MVCIREVSQNGEIHPATWNLFPALCKYMKISVP